MTHTATRPWRSRIAAMLTLAAYVASVLGLPLRLAPEEGGVGPCGCPVDKRLSGCCCCEQPLTVDVPSCCASTEAADEEPLLTQWVGGVRAARCHGLTALLLTLATGTRPPRATVWQPSWRFLGFLRPTPATALRLSSPVPEPPPRSLCV